MSTSTPTILVGLVPSQPPAVVAAAAIYAEKFGASLVCAAVDTARYTFDALADGSVVALPIDPDLLEGDPDEPDPNLLEMVTSVLDPSGIEWSFRQLAGAPARELARLAEELDAAMIVVGTRERGLRGSLREFFNGSVAAQLAHRQHRPVVVIPLDPVGADGALPWSSDEPA